MQLVRQVMTSRDRCLASLRARSRASRGAIVVCDRYPVREVPLMDGPVTAHLPDGIARRPIPVALTSLERRWYSRIGEPDLLLVLRVPPEVAVERKRGDEPESFVRERCREVWQFDWDRLRGVVVDAGRPLRDVVSDVKGIVWSRL
jgi:hypothetical protein